MSKAIMLSIKPKWVAKILNGEKTIEVRKQFPIEYKGWVYIYCTKDKKKHLYPVALLDKHNKVFKPGFKEDDIDNRANYLNGKVVARFWVDTIDDYIYGKKWSWEYGGLLDGIDNDYERILKDTCLTDDELRNYCDDLCFHAIHISKLEIFDEPKELSEFFSDGKHLNCHTCNEHCKFYLSTNTIDGKANEGCTRYKRITKAPQSFVYVEED